MNATGRRGTVLIVDDAPENIHVLMEALKADHAVLAATSGEKALALLARGAVPDLILLDVVMPGMDGYEVCRRIKADPATQDLPVIFVTSLGDAADEEFGLSLGAIDYLTKPVNPALVRARVKNHLALVQAARLREDVERIVRHDVKTPLTSILSVPELLLLADNLDEHQREMVKRVQDAAYTVLSMINLSVDLFKMERGLYHVRAEPVDLAPVVRRILAAQEDALETRGLAVSVSLEGRPAGPQDRFLVLGEELLCYSLLANLITNAVEASPRGGTIVVDLSGAHPARVTIHNQGAVPVEIRERFFDKYATAGKSRGTGLGTYSSRLIARSQGGEVAFTTSEEAGTTLTVTLPSPGPVTG
jgi:CheY-like chemotaxis protein